MTQIDVTEMAKIYEQERAMYVGGTAYYTNNQYAFEGAMQKAIKPVQKALKAMYDENKQLRQRVSELENPAYVVKEGPIAERVSEMPCGEVVFVPNDLAAENKRLREAVKDMAEALENTSDYNGTLALNKHADTIKGAE